MLLSTLVHQGSVREIECSEQVQLCAMLRLYVSISLAPYSTDILQYMMLQCWRIYTYALKYISLSLVSHQWLMMNYAAIVTVKYLLILELLVLKTILSITHCWLALIYQGTIQWNLVRVNGYVMLSINKCITHQIIVIMQQQYYVMYIVLA